MSHAPIDYDAIAAKLGGTVAAPSAQPDYDAIAAKLGGTPAPVQQTPVGTISADTAGWKHPEDWLHEAANDLRYGGQSTWVGRLAKAVGAQPLYSGVSPETAETVAGPVLGPFKTAEGAGHVLSGHPIQGANEIVNGVGQTLAPILGVRNPEFLPGALKAVLASRAISKGAQAAGVSPETSEFLGNVGAFGAAKLEAKLAGAGFKEAITQPVETTAQASAKMTQLPRAAMDAATEAMRPSAERMAEVPKGNYLTREDALAQARTHGVNLDAAQATDHPVPVITKKLTQYSLGGHGTLERNYSSNLNALHDWAQNELQQYAPEGKTSQELGAQMRNALMQDLEARKASAQSLFSSLDESATAAKPDITPLRDAARQIIKEHGAYYARHPELTPTKAWGIVKDLASDGTKSASNGPKRAGFIAVQDAPPPTAEPTTWRDVQRLRSDLMDVTRNNPDIVKNRANAWLQTLTSKADEVMNGDNSGMSPDDLATFREANRQWRAMKNVYDNPKHAYYAAIRAQNDSDIPNILQRGKPEVARQVLKTIGSLKGDYQRQFAEKLLSQPNGNIDLEALPKNLKKISPDYLETMLGREGAQNIRALSDVSRKAFQDANPSGTAKVLVPAGELAHLVSSPISGAAELATTNAAARALVNPRITDFFAGKKK